LAFWNGSANSACALLLELADLNLADVTINDLLGWFDSKLDHGLET